jgi:hypothetical protein
VSRQLEVMRRNARYRAYKAIGLTIEASYTLTQEQRQEGMSVPLAILHMHCPICDAERGDPINYSINVYGEQPGAFFLAESGLLACIIREGCSHASPLLVERDPPEVQAIAELELLAG